MLVLSRKAGESIKLPEVDVEIRIFGLRKSKVQLGIDAPAAISVRRGELPPRSAPSIAQADQQRLRTELARLETEVIALAELAGANRSDAESAPSRLTGAESADELPTDRAARIAADAVERLIGIKRSMEAASPGTLNPRPISELVTIRSEVIDRLRLGQPDEVQPTDCVRQSEAGYLVCGTTCSVA